MLKQLREQNESRAKLWRGDGVPSSGPLFAAVELVGEVGELCNLIKKRERAERGYAGGKIDMSAIIDELADVIICADLLASELGVDLEIAVREKFNRDSAKRDFPQRIEDDESQTATIARLTAENERLRDEVKSQSERINRLASERDGLSSRLHEFQSSYKLARDDDAATIARLTAENERLRGACNELQSVAWKQLQVDGDREVFAVEVDDWRRFQAALAAAEHSREGGEEHTDV